VKDDPAVSADLTKAWKQLGIDDQAEQARLLVDAVRGGSKDLASLRRTARTGARYVAIAALIVGVAMIAVAATDAFTRWWAVPGVVAVVGGIGAFTTIVTRIAAGVKSVAGIADGIRRGEEAGRNEKVEAALRSVHEAEAREQVIQAQLDQMLARVGELSRELVDMTPGQRLYTFLAERAGSDDYRRHLGLIATIRRDFTELAKLQDRWRRDPTGQAPRPIDRIVLYIDDLDRCTPRQVVEVLQAVHLLLALDLFVVVVGVDPRWLLHSLRDQYRNLLGASPSHAPTPRDRGWDYADAETDLMVGTPHDYLEKIFNVPFMLPAMSKNGFGTMIRRLSEPTQDAPDGAQGESPGHPDPKDVDPEDAAPSPPADAPASVSEPLALSADPSSEVSTAQQGAPVVRTPLQEPELALLASMAPLVRSPREAKRLLNLYRMLRSTQDLSDASRFLGDGRGQGEYQAVAVLLGFLSADPKLLGQILFAEPDPANSVSGGACARDPEISWRAFAAGFAPKEDGSSWRNDIIGPLDAAQAASWQSLVTASGDATQLVRLDDLSSIRFWGPHIARFSFLLSPSDQDAGNKS